nr:cellulose binding domain-containing protein [Micromonospora sp. DSM 115978]
MPFRISVVLTGAAVALAGVVIGGVGSAGASPAAPSTTASSSRTPTPTQTLVCPPALPVSGGVSAVTATSMTISYSMLLSPPCGYNPPVTVTLFAGRDDAQQWRNPVTEAVSGPERYGKVTFDGLTPDTVYWFRFSADGQRDPYMIGSGRTTPGPVCAATAVIDRGWGGGFVAAVTVRNVGTEALDGWRVSWRWSGDERIVALWNAVTEGGGPDVAVRNTSYNGRLAPGGSTSFGMLVTASAPPTGLTLTCGH